MLEAASLLVFMLETFKVCAAGETTPQNMHTHGGAFENQTPQNTHNKTHHSQHTHNHRQQIKTICHRADEDKWTADSGFSNFKGNVMWFFFFLIHIVPFVPPVYVVAGCNVLPHVYFMVSFSRFVSMCRSVGCLTVPHRICILQRELWCVSPTSGMAMEWTSMHGGGLGSGNPHIA